MKGNMVWKIRYKKFWKNNLGRKNRDKKLRMIGSDSKMDREEIVEERKFFFLEG